MAAHAHAPRLRAFAGGDAALSALLASGDWPAPGEAPEAAPGEAPEEPIAAVRLARSRDMTVPSDCAVWALVAHVCALSSQ